MLTTAKLIELCKEAGMTEKQIQNILKFRPPSWRDHTEDEMRYRLIRTKALYGDKITRLVKRSKV